MDQEGKRGANRKGSGFSGSWLCLKRLTPLKVEARLQTVTAQRAKPETHLIFPLTTLAFLRIGDFLTVSQNQG